MKENKSLLHTFATNSRKASMVKSFYVELEREGGDGNAIRFVLAKLAEALEKMPNLVDLRIIPHSPIDDLSEGRISQVIRFVSDRWQFVTTMIPHLSGTIQGWSLQTPYAIRRTLSRS